MNDAGLLELSNDAGLAATVVLTFNFLLGMMLATAYKKNDYWKQLPEKLRRMDLNNIHNLTAYMALIIAMVHPLLLLFAHTTKFSLCDIIFPVNAPHQKLFVAAGTLSLFSIIIIIVTTQKSVKKKMSFRQWKNIHLISYFTALLFVAHGIVMDPELKDKPLDFFDGEKVISELCGILLITAMLFRYKYYLRTNKQS